jgi:hypothetical protein
MAKYNEGGMHPKRIFKTPEEMQSAWGEFKVDLNKQSKEWVKVSYVGKDGERVEEPQKLPLTLEGFKRFCRNNYGEVEHYFSNTDKMYDEFCGICSHIREEIRDNQIIGGMIGFFNPSITQRLNSLVDKQEVEQTGDSTFNVIVHETKK